MATGTLLAMHENEFALMQVKCWQIRRQTKAPQAAGAIHSDFERGFICAEVVACLFPLFLDIHHIPAKFL